GGGGGGAGTARGAGGGGGFGFVRVRRAWGGPRRPPMKLWNVVAMAAPLRIPGGGSPRVLRAASPRAGAHTHPDGKRTSQPSRERWRTQAREAGNRGLARLSARPIPATAVLRFHRLRIGPPPAELLGMPEISRFFGIVVSMLYRDHVPPHFHVRYGGRRARFALGPVRLLEGRLSPRVIGIIMEWALMHEEE